MKRLNDRIKRILPLVVAITMVMGLQSALAAAIITPTVLLSPAYDATYDYYSNQGINFPTMAAENLTFFYSKADNLDMADGSVDYDGNVYHDIYYYDATPGSGETGLHLVTNFTYNSNDGDSIFPVPSRVMPVSGSPSPYDGQFVVYQTKVEDIVDAFGVRDETAAREWDVYLFRRDSFQLFRVSVPGNESLEPNGNSGNEINAGGNNTADYHPPYAVYLDASNPYLPVSVIFETDATSLTGGDPWNDTNGKRDLYVRTTFVQFNPSCGSSCDNTTSLLTRGFDYTESLWIQSNGNSYSPVVSENGRYVAFYSTASNLVLGDTNGKQDVFLMDRDFDGNGIFDEWDDIDIEGNPQGVHYYRVSIDTGGAPTNGDSRNPTISADGMFVAFQSQATDLTLNDTNAATDIFLYQLVSTDPYVYEIKRVSVMTGQDSLETQGNGPSFSPVISGDHRRIGFHTYASNLIEGDTNSITPCYTPPGDATQCNAPDVYVRDTLEEVTWRASVTMSGEQAEGVYSVYAAINSDGRFIAFRSQYKLDREIPSLTQYPQVFRRDQGNPAGNPSLSPTSYDYGRVVTGNSKSKIFRMRFLGDLIVANLYFEVGDPDGTHYIIETGFIDECQLTIEHPGIPYVADEYYHRGVTCDIKVSYTPTALGYHKVRLIIKLLDPNMGTGTISNPVERLLYIGLDGQDLLDTYLPIIAR